MTHDELLAKIDEKRDYAVERFGLDDGFNALRAVVELHRPEEQDHKQYEKCWNCHLIYPCPTIQVIEKELA